MQRLDLDHRLRRALAAVIAGELAERAFRQHIAFAHGAFDHEFGLRRDRQADGLGIGQFDAAAHHAAGDVELGFLCAEYLRRQHEQHRIDAVGDHHLAWLAALPPRFAVEQAMLAGRAIKADAARAMQHLPVAADVDAAGVGRGGERDVARADISAAVAGPEFRRRKTGQVDVVAAQDDFVDRRLALRHLLRSNAPVHDAASFGDHLGDRQVRVDTNGKRITLLARAQHVCQHARPGLVVHNCSRKAAPAHSRRALPYR